MRKIKIVADSSADITTLEQAPFGLAPLKVLAGDKEFVDNYSISSKKFKAEFVNFIYKYYNTFNIVY